MKLKHRKISHFPTLTKIQDPAVQASLLALHRQLHDMAGNTYDDLSNIRTERVDALPTASIDYLGKTLLLSQDGAADKQYKCAYNDDSEAYEWVEIASVTEVDGKATKALDNLASVAINTSLISDTDNTDDLGSAAKQWKDLYVNGAAYIDQLGENLDCNDHQLLNLIIENRTNDTGMTVTGQIWYRTDL